MRNIIITNQNLVSNGFNNKYKYNFPVSARFSNEKIALQSIQLYYSNFNITSQYNNHKFQYKWVNGVLYDVILPDGFYSIAQINDFLKFTMKNNKHFLIDPNQNDVFYLSLEVNPTYYRVQLNENILPANIPLGWNYPSGATWTTAHIVPQFNILENNFTKTIGFSSALYGNQAVISSQSQLGQTYPQISVVNSYLLRCNLLESSNLSISNVLYAFSPFSQFGTLLDLQPPHLLPIDIQKNSQFSSIEIEIVDENFNAIKFEEPLTCLVLAILSPEEL